MLAEPGWDRGEGTAAALAPSGPSGFPRRRRRSDRPLLGVLALAVGVVWLLEVTLVHLSGETIVAILLMLLGLGMVATARRGGRAWPVLLGVALTAVLVSGSASFHLDVPLNGGFGSRLFTPSSAGELQSRYELTAGSLTLDLSQLKIPAQTVDIRQGFGKVTIVVPSTAPVDILADISFGSFTSPGGPVRGGVSVHGLYSPPATTAPLLTIHVREFAGSVAVVNQLPRPPSPPSP